MTFDLVGVGTNSVDLVLRISTDLQSLALTSKAQIAERMTLCGGQTATVCSGCSALGLRVAYVGAFGSDRNGMLVREALLAADVDISHTDECEAPNREAIILLDPTGRRTVFWHRSSQLQLGEERLAAAITLARAVHVDDDDVVLAMKAARMARRRGVAVTSDIEHLTRHTEALIAEVTHPIFDSALPVSLSGESDPERALRKLRRLNPNVLCMTLGDRGAAALEGDRFYYSEGFNVEVQDTTGAGDVFRAGYIYGLSQGWTTPDILRFANAAGALSCTRLGAIASVPTLMEIDSRLKAQDSGKSSYLEP